MAFCILTKQRVSPRPHKKLFLFLFSLMLRSFIVSFFILCITLFIPQLSFGFDTVSLPVTTTKPKFSRSLDTHISTIIDGDLFIAPNRYHRIQSGWLVISSVEWYSILTNGVTLCSQITRLTLERLTGKASWVGRSGDIPKWDAITLILQGKADKLLKYIGTMSGSLTWDNSLDKLITIIEKHTRRSSYMLRDMYLHHTSSRDFNQWHRFVLMRGSDKKNYIIDPVLWSGHAYPKPLWEYFTSIWNIKQGGVLYIWRWYKASNIVTSSIIR